MTLIIFIPRPSFYSTQDTSLRSFDKTNKSKIFSSNEYDMSIEKKKNCARAYKSQNLSIKMEGQALTFSTTLLVIVTLFFTHSVVLFLLALMSQNKYEP